MNASRGAEIQLSDAVSTVANGIFRAAKKHYFLSSMYAIGIIAALLGTGLSVSHSAGELYDAKMEYASQVTSSELSREYEKLRRADELYYRHKGWFSCDQVCTKYYNEATLQKERFEKIKEKRDALLLEARREVGVWSVYGISDIRREFWNAWEKGKDAAKRMTMIDAMFIGIGSMFGSSNDRDNSFLATVIQILFQFIMNLTVGLFTSLVFFLFEAWAIIMAYGPSFLSAITLFLVVFCAAGAVFVTTIGGATGALIGGIYLAARAGEKNARLGAQHRRNPPRHLHWD